MVYKCFGKIYKGSGVAMLANKSAINNKNKQNEQLAEELHKPIIRQLEKQKVRSSFKNNIWGVDLANMHLVRKFIKGFVFYYVLLIFLVNMHELLF